MRLRSFRICILFVILCAATCCVIITPVRAADPAAATETERIVIEHADYLKNERDTGLTTLRGGAIFKYRESTVNADEAVLDEKNKTAVAKHNIRVIDSKGVFTGEALFYDYDREWFEITNGSGSTTASGVNGPVFFKGRLIQGTKTKINLYNVEFTTCEPKCRLEYHMLAKSAVVYPDNKVIARDVYFYMGTERILYFPIYVVSLKQNRRYMPEFGYDKNMGFYVLTNYPYMAKEFMAGWILLDLMTKKGVRYGAEHEYKSKRLGGDGHNKFETNRESDTGNSSNQAVVSQKIQVGDKISGDLNYNRKSTYNEYLRGSRVNSNTFSLNATRTVNELKENDSGGIQKGTQRRSTTLTYNKSSSQGSGGSQTNDNINVLERINFSQRLNTTNSYQYTSQSYSSRAKNLDGRFKSDTTYSGNLYSLTMSLQRTYDLDGDENTSDNFESLNVMWPKISLNLQQKLYQKIIPQKLLPISVVQLTNERIRQGTRIDSDALRRNTLFMEARKKLFQQLKSLDFNITQTYTQYSYSTKDAEYIMNHISDMNYSFNQRIKLNFNFNSVKDSGGSPYKNSSQREQIRLKSGFNITNQSTNFSMTTQYDYRMPPDRHYSPLTYKYNRTVTQNSLLTIGGSRDINNSIWNDTNTSMEIKRKNTIIRLSALWNTMDLDLRTATVATELARNNGWQFSIQSAFEHKSKYGIIREVIAKKTNCCTETEMKYNTLTDEFQFHYLILAFPSKKFGFSQSNQGFEIDESAFNIGTNQGNSQTMR